MRVIITGGSGLIGRPLTRLLLELGYEVVVLTRSGKAPSSGAPAQGATYVLWDGRTADSWGSLADGAKAIVNLAGENIGQGRWDAKKKERIRQSRLDAGKAVVEAVRRVEKKPEVLVQASAVGYYGDRGAELLTEASGPGRGFLAETARDWEQSAAETESMGVRRVIIRTGVVLTSKGGALAKMLPPFRMFFGGPLGDGNQFFPWIHREDEVEAIRFLLECEDAKGAYNLAAPGIVDMNGFSRELAKALRRPCFFRVPAFALRLVFGEMAEETILASCRARPERLLEAGFVFKRPSLDAAFQEIRRQT